MYVNLNYINLMKILVHKMRLNKIPFEKIDSGNKTIESRLFDKKRRIINVGDSIEFEQYDNNSKKITAKVIAIYRYPSFSEMFYDFSPKYFGGGSRKSLLKEINNIYSPREQSRFGVVGIKIHKTIQGN